MPELNPDQSIVSEEIDISEILIHIAQIVKIVLHHVKQFNSIQCPFISFHQDLIKKKTPVLDLENFPLWQPM